MWRRLSVLHVLVLACAAALCVAGVSFVLQQGGTSRAQEGAQVHEIHMRSFAPGATGRLTMLEGGASVRLIVMRLPLPQTLHESARYFVAWAVARGGGYTVKVGIVPRDADGNGVLEFFSPSALERYSIIVTAEPIEQAAYPRGPLILATRSGEVIVHIARNAARDTTIRGTVMYGNMRPAHPRRSDFFSDFDEALRAGETRTLTLIGGEVTPRARGTARTATRNGKTYVRVRVKRLPPPSVFGENLYLLWAHDPAGHRLFLGNFPDDINHTELYIREENVTFNVTDLLVTAEDRWSPILHPSSHQALVTSASRLLTRHRFWRRRRCRRSRAPRLAS
jgi:hypothetical protein